MRQVVQMCQPAHLANLEKLFLCDCAKIADVSALAGPKELQQLNLSQLPVRDVAVLTHLTKLEKLEINHCKNIDAIPPLSTLEDLQILDVKGCPNIQDISCVSHLKNKFQGNSAA